MASNKYTPKQIAEMAKVRAELKYTEGDFIDKVSEVQSLYDKKLAKFKVEHTLKIAQLEIIHEEITSMKNKKPTKIKIGDVFAYLVGGKRRPCVVIKVKEDIVHYIALTTTENFMVIHPCKSRFYSNSFFAKEFSVAKTVTVVQNFLGVYDCPRSLDKAIKLLKKEFDI